MITISCTRGRVAGSWTAVKGRSRSADSLKPPVEPVGMGEKRGEGDVSTGN